MEPVLEGSGSAPEERRLREYLVFEVEANRYALPVEDVREVLPALEVDRLPGSTEDLLGMITLRGQMVPVVDTRTFLGAPPRPTELRDHFVVAEVGGMPLVIPCDRVLGIENLSADDDAEAFDLVAAGQRFTAVVRDDDGLLLVPDFRGCLPPAEAA